MKIGMWSGPRNLSTAMMYSFAARGDCAVVDEPFYAPYLALTGADHPMRAEILAGHETDPDRVIASLKGSNPEGMPHFYQKHMPHHMVPEIRRDWIAGLTNVILLRHPARVIASYAAKRENPTLEDIGFRQQAELFDLMRSWGQSPVVIDSFDIRENPKVMLAALCEAIGLPFTERMLSWPKGGHPSDGAWASHWYGAVWNSTGFAEPEGPLPDVPDQLRPVLDAALPLYDALSAHALRSH